MDGFLHDPRFYDALSLVKGFRNGLVYGAKIRFPHALVMTLLFRSGSLQSKLAGVLKATREHARGLAFYVLIYKVLMLLQRSLTPNGKNRDLHAFIAGAAGGYYMFGKNTSVNHQIVLYAFSRTFMGLVNFIAKEGLVKGPSNSFALFAALSWGGAMILFHRDKSVLQRSLQTSMTYLYEDSNRWTSLKTLLWHNK
ncbi:hypothetical protein GGF46_002550 [Coemansia sp. RSA 552]|nr:hypothetical protein GGF46_002550 [Coemansia sp. RSA 552]